MAVVKKIDFARLAGVSRMAVTLGCRRGNLVSLPDGTMDTEDPTNKKYLDDSRKPGRRIGKKAGISGDGKSPKVRSVKTEKNSEKSEQPEMKPKSGPEKSEKPKRNPGKNQNKKPPLKILPMPDLDVEERQPPRGMPEDAAGQMLNLKERKDMADIRLKNSQADRHVQARAERMGLLVLKSEVDKILAVLGAELRTRLLDMPRRITPQIVALVQSGSDAREIETLLDTEITDAVKHAKETAHRAGVKDF